MAPFNQILRPAWRSPVLAAFFCGLFSSTTSGQVSAGAKSIDDLFMGTNLVRIQIQIPEAGIATLRKYNWQGKESGKGQRVDVKAIVREGDRIYRDVAVHLKGAAGSFRSIDSKPSLTLNFDKFVKEQSFHGLEKVSLNNSVQDPTYVNEIICREMFAAAGIPVPRAGHAVVELNDRKLGLYVLTEGFNKQFLKRHFKNATGNLYDGGFVQDIDQPLELDSGSNPKDRSDLKALLTACEAAPSNRLAHLERVLDVDRFITMLAMEIMQCHWDGYALNRNNYRIYHDPDSNKLVFMPHGLDQMFGWDRVSPQMKILPGGAGDGESIWMQGVVARAVLQIPEGRRRYLDQMTRLSTNILKPEVLIERVNQLAARIRPALTERSPQGAKAYAQQVTDLCRRITARSESVRSQLSTPREGPKFDANGTLKLGGWKSTTDFGKPTLAEVTSAGKNLLQISAGQGSSVGAWRVKVPLDVGPYRLQGKVKAQGVAIDPGDRRGGGGFRVVIGAGSRRQLISGTTDWTNLTLDFDVPDYGEVELLCELRSAKGEVSFDVDSLKLIRK